MFKNIRRKIEAFIVENAFSSYLDSVRYSYRSLGYKVGFADGEKKAVEVSEKQANEAYRRGVSEGCHMTHTAMDKAMDNEIDYYKRTIADLKKKIKELEEKHNA